MIIYFFFCKYEYIDQFANINKIPKDLKKYHAFGVITYQRYLIFHLQTLYTDYMSF